MKENNYECQYMSAMEKCLNEGYDQVNTRTGKGVKRLEHVVFRVEDLENELPIPQAKKLYTNSAIDEILWIMQRQSNKRADINSKIWDEWTGADGTIGKAYGYQIAPNIRTEAECYIAPKLVEDVDINADLPVRLFPKVHCDFDSEKNTDSNIVGSVCLEGTRDEFTVIRYCGKSASTNMYDIQYTNTGYIYGSTSVIGVIDAFKNKDVSWNCGMRNVNYVGYRAWGMNNHTCVKDDVLRSKLSRFWENMIKSVYNENSSRKDPNVFVDARWHNLENFLIDARYLPNWRLAKDNIGSYVLSKEYFKSNCYSMDTCVWLPKIEEEDYLYLDMYSEPNEDGKYLRKKLNVNQINNIILAIKNDPSSRRMVTSIWNPFELDEMNLEPCVFSADFTVVGDRLNCMLFQRSGDCCLGVPFNTFQYAILTKLLAKSCGLKAGKLTHCIADFHIYDDQLEGATLQVERFKVLDAVYRGEVINFEALKESGVLTEDMTRDYLENMVKSEPKLVLKDDGSTVDFYDWDLNKNISIEGYVCMPPIKYKVAK